ncbi:hypothetical protein GJV04_18755 [Enterobacteriaceae bacterium RIT714]|nr:hypothetical protein [Enterobacteriaceae bacterium RIT714]
MIKSAIVLLMIAFISPFVQAGECAKPEADAAEMTVDNLKTWASVYDNYVRYQQCDEGSIGEGHSEAIIRLLVDHWNELPTLEALAKQHPPFADWVLSHIDSTLNADDLEKAANTAQSQCPLSDAGLCQKIAAAALHAVAEN